MAHHHPQPDPHGELPLDPDGAVLQADAPSPATAARPAHTRPLLVLAVALGGLAGTPVRYAAELAWPAAPGQWPIGTFTVNIVGALVVGALLEALARAGDDRGWRRVTRLTVGTGFLGALTTYSSLSVEIDLLLDHRWWLAPAYAVTSVLAGTLAAATGIATAAAIHRRRTATTTSAEVQR